MAIVIVTRSLSCETSWPRDLNAVTDTSDRSDILSDSMQGRRQLDATCNGFSVLVSICRSIRLVCLTWAGLAADINLPHNRDSIETHAVGGPSQGPSDALGPGRAGTGRQTKPDWITMTATGLYTAKCASTSWQKRYRRSIYSLQTVI